MKTMVRFGAVLAVLLFMSVGVAKADTLQYSLTGPGGFDASWTMSSTPSVSVDWLIHSFDAPVSNLVVNGVLAGNQVVTFYAALLLTQGVSGDNLADFVVATDSLLAELFSGPLNSPTMNTGLFNVYGYPSESLSAAHYNLSVSSVAASEPATFLLLGVGLVVLALLIRQRQNSPGYAQG